MTTTITTRDLLIGEMITASAAWIGPKKALFLSVPEVAPLFDHITSAHAALVAARDDGEAETSLADIAALAERLDDRHDHLLRGFYYLLLAAASLERANESPDESRAAAIDQARSALLPDQLRAIQASYEAEAGNAAQFDALASDKFPDLLSSIHVSKTQTALDIAHDVRHVGQKLGETEDNRALFAAKAKQTTLAPADVRRRMRDWSNVAEATLRNLALTKASQDTVDALRQPLLDAIEKAAARRREKRAAKPSPASNG